MKLIYKAKDIIEAHIISGLLKSSNIDSHVGDEDVDEAISIIRAYEARVPDDQED